METSEQAKRGIGRRDFLRLVALGVVATTLPTRALAARFVR